MRVNFKSSVRLLTGFSTGVIAGSGVSVLNHHFRGSVLAASSQTQPQPSFNVFSLSDDLRGISRFCDCALAVVFIAVDYKITLFNKSPLSEDYYELKSKVHKRSALRLREMCCRNGGVFIKVGQHVGSLDYLFPAEYVEVMKVLHSQAPYSSIEDVYSVIEEELGKTSDELFVEFNPVPCGAASLAQAHTARLQTGGDLVVVKVQHKNVKKFSYLDMRTMEFLVGIAEYFFPEFRFRWLVETTKINLPKELDFKLEGENCEKAEQTYKHLSDFLKFPRIYHGYTTHRILTMEYCSGFSIDDVKQIKKNGINEKEVVRQLGKLYSDMIFTHGLMHCDPHPGNLLVQKDPVTDKSKIVLLDHGLYQQLTDEFRIEYCHLWLGLISGDINLIQKAANNMGTPESKELFACVVAGRSWESVSGGTVATNLKTLEEEAAIQAYAVKVVPQLTSVLDRVPRQLLLILKTNDLIRAIQSKLGHRSDLSAFLAQSRACFWSLARHDMRKYSKQPLVSRLWGTIQVATSLCLRLCYIRLVEYSFLLGNILKKAGLFSPDKTNTLVRQITA